MMEGKHICIAGAGSAGLFTAWYLSRMGQRVSVFEAGRIGGGATTRSAGMLLPAIEFEFQEMDFLKACLESRKMYSEFEKEAGDIGLDRAGAMEVALTGDDAGYLRRLYEAQKNMGLHVEWIQGSAIRDLEPCLAPHIQSAVLSPDDIQLDPLLLVQRLAEGIRRAGGEIFEEMPVQEWKTSGEKIEVRAGGAVHSFDKLLLAVGATESIKLPYRVFPVRGEIISLRKPDYEFLQRSVRVRSKTYGLAYLAPKRDRILLGSTTEEKGFHAVNTAGGMLDILRKCYAVVPGIYELDVIETWSGLRPSTLSRLPLIEKDAEAEVYHLNGLYRNGILIGPLAGQSMASLMMTGNRHPLTEHFSAPSVFIK